MINPYNIKIVDGEEIASPNKIFWDGIKKQKYSLLLDKSKIPPFYKGIEFDDYQGELSKDNVAKAIKYAKKCFSDKFEHVHLYLWGQNSCQKTALACNVGKEALKQGKRMKFVLAGDLIDRLMKNQGFNYHKDIEAYINSLKQTDMLIIDDAFTNEKSLMWRDEESKKMIVSEWDRFLRSIVVSDTKLIITSNISHRSIGKHYGSSMFELIERNFITLQFLDSVTSVRTKKLSTILDDEEE